ncbi:MAG: hypothetical protein IKG84_00055 [Bacteroidales bacterium]|nr:hypothetical protein [Bacteroidales bacterium]
MVFRILILSLVSFLAVWPVLRSELPAVIGPVWASGAGERWSVKILLPLLFIGALVCAAWGVPVDSGLLPAFPSSDLPSLFAIVLSTLAAVFIASLISADTAVPYAFLGSIAGFRLVTEGALDWTLAARTVASWIVAPLLCCLLAAGVAAQIARRSRNHPVHLAVSDHRLLLGCTLAAFLLAGASAWNLGSIVAFFPVAAFGFGPVSIAVATVPALLLFLLLHPEFSVKTWRVADQDLDFTSGPVFAILSAMGLTYLVFSLPVLSRVGLTATPLPAPVLLLSALTGVSLARRKAFVEGEKILKSALSTLVCPILGVLICYSVSMVLNVSPEDAGRTGWNARLTPTLIVLGIIVIAAVLALYFRAQRRRDLQKEILLSREQQIYNAQKTLSALEVRAEMNEKDLLNKLEIKRKELVDFAVGISEQKEYMESVYDRLAHVRELTDSKEKDAATDELLISLRERMYFSREMNDFYAQSEILHKDFNMRLKEAFPNLTESERKLANLLRQGFSSKYIATLMNITPKSVEISRYRLRMKLGLRRSDNLVQFIKSI